MPTRFRYFHAIALEFIVTDAHWSVFSSESIPWRATCPAGCNLVARQGLLFWKEGRPHAIEEVDLETLILGLCDGDFRDFRACSLGCVTRFFVALFNASAARVENRVRDFGCFAKEIALFKIRVFRDFFMKKHLLSASAGCLEIQNARKPVRL